MVRVAAELGRGGQGCPRATVPRSHRLLHPLRDAMGAPHARRDGSVKLADQAVARPSWRKLRSGLERGDARGDRTSQGFEAPGAK